MGKTPFARRWSVRLLVGVSTLLSADTALAQWTAVAPGIDRMSRTDPGPRTIDALRINLCEPGVRLRATTYAERGQRTSAWAADQGAVAATNGGYFLFGSFEPDNGVAAGGGSAWPTSTNSAVRGMFAVGRNQLFHAHAWETIPLPAWTQEAVNGDATLVDGGAAVDCGGCGGGRAPRTAVGYTSDRRTVYLVTVDGRTSSSIGMTIDELAGLMAGFGVERAMNLDGGGSTTMWVEGIGVINAPSDGSERVVSNHLGVFYEEGQPAQQCPDACQSIPSVGGTIEQDDPCFETFGPSKWWRYASAGQSGLIWTNAFQSADPSNWARWDLNLQAAQPMRVDVYIDPTWGVFSAAHYRVRAGGAETDVFIDQGAASGWTELGEFDFAAGGDEWVSVYDNTPNAPGGDQHIAIDALRIVPIDPGCRDDTDCDSGQICDAGECIEAPPAQDAGVENDAGLSESDAALPPADAGPPAGEDASAGTPDVGPTPDAAGATKDVEGSGSGCACVRDQRRHPGLPLLALIAIGLMGWRALLPDQKGCRRIKTSS